LQNDFPQDKARDIVAELNALPIADRPAYARQWRDLGALEDEMLRIGCPTTHVGQLISELQFYQGEVVLDESVRLLGMLRASLLQPGESSSREQAGNIEESFKPRFKTMLPALNNLTYGGGYGLTTVAGDAKAGKTMFAIGTAVEAARDGWRVVYLNAELDKVEVMLAIMRYCRGEISERVNERLTVVTCDYTFQPMDAVSNVEQSIGLGDSAILLVLDSINALVDLAQDAPGVDYWALNALWRNFAIRATRMSLGKLGFLVISETNKDGGVKGRTLEYKSDLVVTIKQDKGDREYVEIDATHSRSTRSGVLGLFKRNRPVGRFDQCE
jgi:hypothetical protein